MMESLQHRYENYVVIYTAKKPMPLGHINKTFNLQLHDFTHFGQRCRKLGKENN